MTADGDAEARNEIDTVRWLGIPDAASLLSYPGDRELLATFAALPSLRAQGSCKVPREYC